jgi:GST-like protein
MQVVTALADAADVNRAHEPRHPPSAGVSAKPGQLLYPTYTYADDPSRFVKDEAARAGFRAECDAYAQRLWLAVEMATGAPWFLGQRLSALELYFAVMTRLRPRRDWYAEHAPRILAAGERAAALEAVVPVMARNFDG